MMNRDTYTGICACLVCVAIAGLTTHRAMADVRLPHIFCNNMVVQCDISVPVWGWASPGEQVVVKFGTSQVKTTTNAQGEWIVKLPAQKAGEPRRLEVAGKNSITLDNVLVGEVWLCSGQSNMQMGIASCDGAQEEIAKANYPDIRLFVVGLAASGEPQSDCRGEWRVCTPEALLGSGAWPVFSAAAYYFGRDIHLALKTPVGLIQSAWGGTRIEPWTPPAGFAQAPELNDISLSIEDANRTYRNTLQPKLDEIGAWVKDSKKAIQDGAPIPPRPQWPKHPLDSDPLITPNPLTTTSLYNGMIRPLAPFALRGAIWYQGEGNVADRSRYAEKMKALIGGWRAAWNEGEFPFYYVQIAPLPGYETNTLPLMWDAQLAALAIPNTGLASTQDIADLNDIHPKNKLDVGKRLARWALAKTYGKKDIVCSGPIYRAMNVKGNKVRISFDYVGSGLMSRDNQPLTWFTIAGQDRKFVPAQAEIEKENIVVWSDSVAAPVAARFAWDRVAQPNLMNKDSLPALPFRTDRW
ncbi:MAG: sialate O-acetylesterase [Candidatus Hydrogenedentes bacterium]|nr:sialate O-acetylesterase [Candidatus Hydrogenedentota bacterium]